MLVADPYIIQEERNAHTWAYFMIKRTTAYNVVWAWLLQTLHTFHGEDVSLLCYINTQSVAMQRHRATQLH